MAKPVIKIGHLKITDHLVLGMTKYKLESGEENFQNCSLEAVPMMGWDYVGDALCNGDIDAAFILAPYAMELFHSGEKIQLVLLGHKTGSVFIKNKKLNIQKLEDFKGKTILIPFHLSVHMMLIHKLFSQKGMEVGPGKDVVLEVMAPSQIPQAMEWDENGELGGFIVAEPYGSQVVKSGLGEELALSKNLWPDHPCCVFIAKDEIVNRYPEAIQELCTSFVKSGLFIKENPQETSLRMVDFLEQDQEVIKRVLTEPVDRVKTTELMPQLRDLEIIQEYMTKKISALSGKIDLEKFVNLTFAKNAGAK
ncbi:MAG: twin-arginine translocation pathway signal protein [Spirochaetes bacterium GWD1_27_9]|nr:MAG: twin-arginine translocation pathway signal protein [Spirochaetes bacterium GWC1_27_15]OHD40453.1 MAG: twin-arginine translocation pathway signal protein [Spirochaetes bacterium GWD1_27_9]